MPASWAGGTIGSSARGVSDVIVVVMGFHNSPERKRRVFSPRLALRGRFFVSDSIDEAAWVKDSFRIEGGFYIAHQPGVGGCRAPHVEGRLPVAWAGQNEIGRGS